MITFDGNNKLIILDTDLSFNVKDIYDSAVDWAVLHDNMQFLIPMVGSGKNPLGGGVYTDIIFVLSNGWKLQPSGYSEGDIIVVKGTLITDDGTSRTVPQSVGDCPIWEFQVATYGTLTEGGGSGGGLTTEEHNTLMGLPDQVEDSGLISGSLNGL